MEKNPRVAIVIVNYNNAEDIIECLQSLKNISYGNAEIIVVDNGSTDGSVGKLQIFKAGFSLLTSEANLGFAGGNNIGIRYAIDHKAGYVLFLNNDTVVDPGFIEPLLEKVLNENKVGAVGGKIYYYDDPERIWYAGGSLNCFSGRTKHSGKNKIDTGKYDKTREVGFITGCLMLIPREVIENVGMMDEKYFLYFEDADWCYRIRKAGYKLIYSPQSRIYHKESATTQRLNNVKAYYYYRNIHYFAKKNLDPIFRISVFIYLRLYLLLMMAKNIITLNFGKIAILLDVVYSIRHGIMGKYNMHNRGRAKESL